MEDTKFAKEKFDQLEEFIHSMPTKEGELIKVLHKAQEIFGYLPKEVQHFVAKQLDVPTAKVYGVVTFYSFFNMEPKGLHTISVCMGTACYVRGAETVLEEFKKQLGIDCNQTSNDGKFTLDALRCVGACGLAPVVMVDNKVYGRVTKEMVKDIIAEYV